MPRRVVDIGDDTGAAAHVDHFGLRPAGLIELQVVRRVKEREVGEQPLGADAAGQLEQVVVRVGRIVVDAFLDLEDLNRKNRRFAVTETGFGRQQDVAGHHPAFRRNVGAVIDRAERHLGAGPAVHGVQVVNQGFHRLKSGFFGFLQRLFQRVRLRFFKQFRIYHCRQHAEFFFQITVAAGDFRFQLQPLADFAAGQPDFFDETFLIVRGKFQRLGQVVPVAAGKGFAYAISQTVIERRDALAAMLVVLVGLDGDAGEGRITGDVIRFAQESVTGVKPVLKQFLQVDLATGGGEGVKIEVVDMDVAVVVRFGMLRLEDVHLVKDLGAFGAIFQHRTHGGVTVDIGVVPLQVAVLRVAVGDLLVGFHQAGVHFTGPGPFGPVQDICFGGLRQTGVNQNRFDDVLDFFYGWSIASRETAFGFLRHQNCK